jgi:hypothetical protein
MHPCVRSAYLETKPLKYNGVSGFTAGMASHQLAFGADHLPAQHERRHSAAPGQAQNSA